MTVATDKIVVLVRSFVKRQRTNKLIQKRTFNKLPKPTDVRNDKNEMKIIFI